MITIIRIVFPVGVECNHIPHSHGIREMRKLVTCLNGTRMCADKKGGEKEKSSVHHGKSFGSIVLEEHHITYI